MDINKTTTPRLVWSFLFLILILSAALNIYHNNFPTYFHFDEIFKVHIIRGHGTPFLHPMLMVQLAKIVSNILPYVATIEIGRTISAVCGTTAVLLIFYIAKKSLRNDAFALLTALALAVSPTLVIHSHYLKESIYFTMCELFFLLQLINYSHKQSTSNILLLGLALGLTISSEYIGILSFLLLLVLPFLNPVINKKSHFKILITICMVAGVVFLIINYPLLLHPQKFWHGLNSELNHAKKGHRGISIYAWDFYWTYHLTHSIVPGITLMVTALAIMGILLIIYNWKNEPVINKILLVYVLLFYLLEETSPLKPYPDFQRYMLCLSPVLILFAVLTINRIYLLFHHQNNSLIVIMTILIALTIAYPLYITANLDYYLTKDTRLFVENWILTSKQRFLYSEYSTTKQIALLQGKPYDSISDIQAQAKAQHARFLIISSFVYQRYIDALNSVPEQSTHVYTVAKTYKELFKHFYFIEFKPSYYSFAFSNPTIRIVDLQSPK